MQALYSFFVLLLALTVSAVPVKRSTLDVSRLVVFGGSFSPQDDPDSMRLEAMDSDSRNLIKIPGVIPAIHSH